MRLLRSKQLIDGMPAQDSASQPQPKEVQASGAMIRSQDHALPKHWLVSGNQ
jgi:hypothetical protein